jgi:hypothetical protein
MSEIKRKVNDKMRLRAALTGGETNLFVRASLFDQLGAPIAPVTANLPHLAKGTYGENTIQMPNLEQVFVRTEVFLDAGFTILAPRYRDLGLDIYSHDTLDPAQLVPKAYNVNAVFERKDTFVRVEQKPEVIATVESNDITAKVDQAQAQVKAKIETQNEIEGVIND